MAGTRRKSITNFEFSTYLISFSQRDYLANVYGSVYSVFLSAIFRDMEAIPELNASGIKPYIQILESIKDHQLLRRFEVDMQARIEDVITEVKESAVVGYHRKFKELESRPGVNRALPLLLVTHEIEKWAKALEKSLEEPILGYSRASLISRATSLTLANAGRSMWPAWWWRS